MLNNPKRPAPAVMVIPHSFLPVFLSCASCESTIRAFDIVRAYIRLRPESQTKLSWDLNTQSPDVFNILGAIYEAGRIQGIREERRKKQK